MTCFAAGEQVRKVSAFNSHAHIAHPLTLSLPKHLHQPLPAVLEYLL